MVQGYYLMRQPYFRGLLLTILLSIIGISGCEVNSSQDPLSSGNNNLSELTQYHQNSAVIELTSITDPLSLEFVPTIHNLWTSIDRSALSLYMYDWVTNFTYSSDGSIWIVGGFGILQQFADGNHNWFHIKNGLDHQFFTTVAIAPNGEVWVGGTNNSLYRYSGLDWVNEGKELPAPFENDFQYWLCYSDDISGIDFSIDGSPWVMNNGIELYTKVYNQWMNFRFPKETLPMAGGGGCPIGIQVTKENDITIMRNGCCMAGDTGYHFDGNTWQVDADYSAVSTLLESRRGTDIEDFYINYYGSTLGSALSNWPFEQDQLLPEGLYPQERKYYELTIDDTGVIWILEGNDLYSNASGYFKELYSQGIINEDASLIDGRIVSTISDAFYYEDRKKPYRLIRIIQEQINDENSYLSVDSIAVHNGHLWFYSREGGLYRIEEGIIQLVSKIPDPSLQIGGIFIFSEEKVWIGSEGHIWEYDSGNWRKIFYGSSELIRFFAANSNGAVFGATDTSIFRFENNTYTMNLLVDQGVKPAVYNAKSQEPNCEFHKNYIDITNCNRGVNTPGFTYEAIFFDVLEDDSLVYINNRIIAKGSDSQWKSFLFDSFPIYTGVVDNEGNYWLLTPEGLLNLQSNIFEYYQVMK